jgi:hypothetical protein
MTMMPYKDLTTTTRDRRQPAVHVDNVVLMPDRERAIPERTPLAWLV